MPIRQAAGYLCMSAEMLKRIYGRHNPDYMRAAAEAITAKQPKSVSSVELQNGTVKRQKI